MASTAGIYNMIVDQGATLTRGIIKKDSQRRVVPLTGYTARMQVRESLTSASPILTMTTENDRLIIDARKGQITISVPATDMENIPAGKYVYDLELIDGDGVVERLLMGSFTVRAEVTR